MSYNPFAHLISDSDEDKQQEAYNPFASLIPEPGTELVASNDPVLPVIDNTPEPKPSYETIDASQEKMFTRGALERAGDLGGGFTRFAGTTFKSATDFIETHVPMGIVGVDEDGLYYRATTQEDMDRPSVFTKIAKSMEDADFGYEEQTSWEEVKAEPLENVIPFIMEQGAVSTPDMVAAMLNLPAYITARIGEIGQKRAENNDKENATFGDFLGAAPAAVSAALLERIGFSRMIGLDAAPISSLSQVPGEVAKRAFTEGVTESIQEPIEYAGETIGTKVEFDPAVAADRALAGFVGGTGVGGGVGAVAATGEAAAHMYANGPEVQPYDFDSDPLLGTNANQNTEQAEPVNPFSQSDAEFEDELQGLIEQNVNYQIQQAPNYSLPNIGDGMAHIDPETPIVMGGQQGVAPRVAPDGLTDQKNWGEVRSDYASREVSRRARSDVPLLENSGDGFARIDPETPIILDGESGVAPIEKADGLTTQVGWNIARPISEERSVEKEALFRDRNVPVDGLPNPTKGVIALEQDDVDYAEREKLDPRFAAPQFLQGIQSLAGELIKGGGSMGTLLMDKHDPTGKKVLSRAPSENPEWFKSQGEGERVTVRYVQEVVEKAINRLALGSKQRRTVDWLIQVFDDRAYEGLASTPLHAKQLPANAVVEEPGVFVTPDGNSYFQISGDYHYDVDTIARVAVNQWQVSNDDLNAIYDSSASEKDYFERIKNEITRRSEEAPSVEQSAPRQADLGGNATTPTGIGAEGTTGIREETSGRGEGDNGRSEFRLNQQTESELAALANRDLAGGEAKTQIDREADHFQLSGGQSTVAGGADAIQMPQSTGLFSQPEPAVAPKTNSQYLLPEEDRTRIYNKVSALKPTDLKKLLKDGALIQTGTQLEQVNRIMDAREASHVLSQFPDLESFKEAVAAGEVDKADVARWALSLKKPNEIIRDEQYSANADVIHRWAFHKGGVKIPVFSEETQAKRDSDAVLYEAQAQQDRIDSEQKREDTTDFQKAHRAEFERFWAKATIEQRKDVLQEASSGDLTDKQLALRAKRDDVSKLPQSSITSLFTWMPANWESYRDANVDMGSEYYQGLEDTFKEQQAEAQTISQAPEHQNMKGADTEQTKDIAAAMKEHMSPIDSTAESEKITRVFDAPTKAEVVRLQKKVDSQVEADGFLTTREAKTQINEWKNQALDQGDTAHNSNKWVISLFDTSGEWSQPWVDAGYQVLRFDIQDEQLIEVNDEHGNVRVANIGDVFEHSIQNYFDLYNSFNGDDVYAVLAACPCTDFASSGARHFAAKDSDGRTLLSQELVSQTMAIIEFLKPQVWALENPVGRIGKLTGLPPWRTSFEPYHFGDTYTKKTLLWGRHNGDMPLAPVDPVEGSKMHSQYGGSSLATKNARSVTPEGFAYAFFMANNAKDHPVIDAGNKYDMLDQALIEQTIEVGYTKADIDDEVGDAYYQDLDWDGGNKILREMITDMNDLQDLDNIDIDDTMEANFYDRGNEVIDDVFGDQDPDGNSVGEAESIYAADTTGLDASIEHFKMGKPERERVLQELNKRPDKDDVLARLSEHSSTPWAKQAIMGVLSRAAINDLIAGVEPAYDSPLMRPAGKGIVAYIKKNKAEGAWDYLSSKGMIGHPEKSENAVNGSFIDCDPSADCAKYCYATKGNYNYANTINKAELVAWAIEQDPVRAAKRVAREYKANAAFDANKALRLFDKGDLNESWVPFIESLNNQRIRTQIFTKRPEILREIGDANLRMLSIDQSNLDVATEYPDLKVAVVYDGSKEMTDWIWDNTDRISVILPVKIGQRVLSESEIDKIRGDKDLERKICPVDSGVVTLDNWSCLKCDKNGGLGCFYGSVTVDALREVGLNITSESSIQDLLREINQLTEGMSNEQRSITEQNLSEILSSIRSGDPSIQEGADYSETKRVDEGTGSYSEEVSGQLEFSYEQDPGKQTEADISAATDARAEVSTWHRKTNGTVLANRVSADFQERGATTLIGQEINDHSDLADLAEIYRNPHFETFRIFYVKDNKVVGQNNITSRLPSAVQLFANKDDRNTRFDEMNAEKERLGATSYFILHNHPSGNPSPSDADISLTKSFARDLSGMEGHVVINGNEYSVIEKGSDGEFDYNLFDREPTGDTYSVDRNPLIEHALLNKEFSKPSQLAEIGWALRDEADSQVQLITRNINGVAGILSIPVEYLDGKSSKQDMIKLAAQVRRFQRQTGGGEAFAVNVPDSLEEIFKAAVKKGVLVDALYVNDDSFRTTLRTPESGFEAKPMWIGENEGEWRGRDLSNAQRKLGLRDKPGVAQKLVDSILFTPTDGIANRLYEGVFDGLYPIKRAEDKSGVGMVAGDYESSGYVSARMAGGVSDVVHALLEWGAPAWEDGHVGHAAGTDGALPIFKELGEDLNDWLGWMAGNRAQILMEEGRENNLNESEINALISLATPDRAATFENVKKQYNAINKSLLDFAEGAGLVDPESRADWESEWYVPFYRQQEGSEFTMGPKKGRGMSHQSSGIKQLKGSEENTGDLLENVLTNWIKLIDASMKNMALLKTVDNLEGTEYLEPAKSVFREALTTRGEINKHIKYDRLWVEQLADNLGLAQAGEVELIHELANLDYDGLQKIWSVLSPDGDDVIRVKRDGKNEFYMVSDPALVRAFHHLTEDRSNIPALTFLRLGKNILTTTVTTFPAFMIRNFIRDYVHAYSINADGMKITGGMRGLHDALVESDSFKAMTFGGASFQGGWVHGTDPEASAQIMRRNLRKFNLSKPERDTYMESLIGYGADAASLIGQIWEGYRSLGDKAENASRLGTYDQSIKSGKSKAQAMFDAKDLMDYSLRGNFKIMLFLTDTVAFMNAHLQGLSKMGRALKDDPAKSRIWKNLILGKIIGLASASAFLAFLNEDEEEWKRLPDWDKDANWHFFIGGQHFRLPRPFEIGGVTAIGDRALLTSLGKMDKDKLIWSMYHNATENFGVDFAPTTLKPTIEAMFNYNIWRASSIESMSEQRRSPKYRYSTSTSETMVELGDLTETSPKKLEHVFKGHMGSWGALLLEVTDKLVINATDRPDKPDGDLTDVPVLNALYRGEQDSVPNTVQGTTDLYDRLAEVNQLYADQQFLLLEGRIELYKEFAKESSAKLAYRDLLNSSAKELSSLRKSKQMIERNRKMDGATKKEKVDDISQAMQDISTKVAKATAEAF